MTDAPLDASRAIARRLIDGAGLSIAISGRGKGARFTLTLPYAGQRQEAQ